MLISHKIRKLIMFEFSEGFFKIESENIGLNDASVYVNHREFFELLGKPLSIFMVDV